MCGGVHDVITGNKLIKIGPGVFELQGSENRVLSLTWLVAITAVQHYRVDRDKVVNVDAPLGLGVNVS